MGFYIERKGGAICKIRRRRAGGYVIYFVKSISKSLIKAFWVYIVVGLTVAIVAVFPVTEAQKINALCVIFGTAVFVSVTWLVIKPLLTLKKIYAIIKNKGDVK